MKIKRRTYGDFAIKHQPVNTKCIQFLSNKTIMNEKIYIIPDINNIEDFFITENNSKDSLLIVLKNWEKIELQISTNIKELYDTLSMDISNIVNNTLHVLIDWATQEAKNIPSGWEIKEGLNSSFFKLMEIKKLLKTIEANAQWALKSIWSNEESRENYWHTDIITKQRIKDNYETLGKLFKVFQRASFSKDDPREYSELNDDEKRVVEARLKEPIKREQEKEENEDSYQITISEKNQQLQQTWLKQELDKLFGFWVSDRRLEQFRTYKKDWVLSKESSEILDVSNQIYKKLVILWLYYKDELHIQTPSGPEIFSWPECIDNSIDWNIYYKDHQEKYGWENRYRFIMDFHWKKKDLYIPIVDVKISDLTYGSMSEVICLLSKKWIAPAFSILLSNSLLPSLWEYKKPPKEVNDDEGDKAIE